MCINTLLHNYVITKHESGNVKHDDVIKWKHFRVTGPLCWKFSGHR